MREGHMLRGSNKESCLTIETKNTEYIVRGRISLFPLMSKGEIYRKGESCRKHRSTEITKCFHQ
jgi:hypothetical protein